MKKILIFVGILAVVAIAFLIFGKKGNVKTESLPKFITSDFIDLSKVATISKFRSGSGHDFSGSGETCRSMKHYYWPKLTEADHEYMNRNSGMPKKPDGKTDIKIFSPVDGEVTNIVSDQTDIGKQIFIQSDKYPEITIRLFHVYEKGITKGQKVKAGEEIGVISSGQSTDVAIQTGRFMARNFVSYFDVMSDELLEKYKERGLKSREDVIISKAERDLNPLSCNGERFSENYDSNQSSEHFFNLNGYKPRDK